jgi:hypothetical protein
MLKTRSKQTRAGHRERRSGTLGCGVGAKTDLANGYDAGVGNHRVRGTGGNTQLSYTRSFLSGKRRCPERPVERCAGAITKAGFLTEELEIVAEWSAHHEEFPLVRVPRTRRFLAACVGTICETSFIHSCRTGRSNLGSFGNPQILWLNLKLNRLASNTHPTIG